MSDRRAEVGRPGVQVRVEVDQGHRPDGYLLAMESPGAETLAEMLQGQLEGSVVTRRLAGNGFVVDRPLRLAVVPGEADDDRVADTLASAGLPYLILRQQDELVVLIQDGEAARAALTGALTGALAGGPAVGARGRPGLRRRAIGRPGDLGPGVAGA